MHLKYQTHSQAIERGVFPMDLAAAYAPCRHVVRAVLLLRHDIVELLVQPLADALRYELGDGFELPCIDRRVCRRNRRFRLARRLEPRLRRTLTGAVHAHEGPKK